MWRKEKRHKIDSDETTTMSISLAISSLCLCVWTRQQNWKEKLNYRCTRVHIPKCIEKNANEPFNRQRPTSMMRCWWRQPNKNKSNRILQCAPFRCRQRQKKAMNTESALILTETYASMIQHMHLANHMYIYRWCMYVVCTVFFSCSLVITCIQRALHVLVWMFLASGLCV